MQLENAGHWTVVIGTKGNFSEPDLFPVVSNPSFFSKRVGGLTTEKSSDPQKTFSQKAKIYLVRH